MVRTMVACGVQQEIMAKCVGVNENTLRKYYRDEIDTALAKANAKVCASLYRKAISDDHPQSAMSAMFWLKCRARWRPTSGIEVSGDEENPLRTETTHKIDFSDLTDEELEVVRAILARRAG